MFADIADIGDDVISVLKNIYNILKTIGEDIYKIGEFLWQVLKYSPFYIVMGGLLYLNWPQTPRIIQVAPVDYWSSTINTDYMTRKKQRIQ